MLSYFIGSTTIDIPISIIFTIISAMVLYGMAGMFQNYKKENSLIYVLVNIIVSLLGSYFGVLYGAIFSDTGLAI